MPSAGSRACTDAGPRRLKYAQRIVTTIVSRSARGLTSSKNPSPKGTPWVRVPVTTGTSARISATSSGAIYHRVHAPYTTIKVALPESSNLPQCLRSIRNNSRNRRRFNRARAVAIIEGACIAEESWQSSPIFRRRGVLITRGSKQGDLVLVAHTYATESHPSLGPKHGLLGRMNNTRQYRLNFELLLSSVVLAKGRLWRVPVRVCEPVPYPDEGAKQKKH
jgi:hypothetical protein